MASITKDIRVAASSDEAWAALCDYGAVDTRVAAGFVTESVLDGPDRVLTFASGAVARERLVTLDDEQRRLVYAVVESPLGAAHHQASVTVTPDGTGARLVWTTDVLPDELAPVIDGLMTSGAAAMARTLR